MARGKSRGRPPQPKWSTKFKRAPVKTLKAEWTKMGPVGKLATVAVGAGISGGAIASQVNALPIIGRFMRIGTSAGANIRRRLRI
jgi:hypothetical protein